MRGQLERGTAVRQCAGPSGYGPAWAPSGGGAERGRPRRERGGERQAEAAAGGRRLARRAGERRMASGPRAGGAGELAAQERGGGSGAERWLAACRCGALPAECAAMCGRAPALVASKAEPGC
jgi:hypothetical protein